MLLTPHHFQYQDQYQETQLSERFRILSPFGWGVGELDIDKDGLVTGNFTLLQFRGLLDDGLIIRIPDPDPIPETRPVEEWFSPSMDHLEVFLGIPKEHEGGINCQFDQGSSARRSRYFGTPHTTKDFNTGENSREVVLARKNLRILFGGEDKADFSTLKIAELIRTPGGALVPRNTFIPPSIWISSTEYLPRLARGQLEILTAMVMSLSDLQRGLSDQGGVDPRRLSLHQTLASYIPVLSHYTQVGMIHPESLYLTLSRLAAQLSAFSPDLNPKDLPPYDHLNLSRTFRELDLKFREVMEQLSPTRYQAIPLESKGKYLLMGTISDPELLQSGQFYLVASGEALANEAAQQSFTQGLKVGAVDDMEVILKSAMSGVRLHPTIRPAANIPVKTGHFYYRLETHGNYWQRITETQRLAIYVPSGLQDMKIELLATKD